jgi:UDP-4-amino-4,6-dideoxy-N-acetyl-beta-L-altrosamine transaminase
MIPYAKPSINNQDRKAVLDVLKTDFLTQGPKVEEFEEAICKQVNAKYCIATNSATSALHLACIALGIQKNDLVYVSAITFVASANCAQLLGAKIELVDINLSDYNISIDDLKKKLISAKKANKLPKLLIVTHMAGYPCDMLQINKLAKIYKFKVIEDASHAFGSYYLKHPVGKCQYSNLTVFSFHAIKNITTGEGGCITCNNLSIYKKIISLRSHGIIRNKKKIIGFKSLLYKQNYIGFNYRMNEIQAALGLSQLRRLSQFKKKRENIFNKYLNNLKKSNHLVLPNYKHKDIFYHLFLLRFENTNLREKYIRHFNLNKIKINFNYIPLFHFKEYSKINNKKKYPNSNLFFKTTLSIPIYYELSNRQQNLIIDLLEKK